MDSFWIGFELFLVSFWLVFGICNLSRIRLDITNQFLKKTISMQCNLSFMSNSAFINQAFSKAFVRLKFIKLCV